MIENFMKYLHWTECERKQTNVEYYWNGIKNLSAEGTIKGSRVQFYRIRATLQTFPTQISPMYYIQTYFRIQLEDNLERMLVLKLYYLNFES